MISIKKPAKLKYNKQLKVISLIVSNLILFTIAIVSTIFYTRYFKKEQENIRTYAFISAVESMKSISANYLNTERGYADDWASYIESQNMNMDEALDYIRTSNTNPDRYAHIVDMDTFEARSTYSRNGDDSVSVYHYIKTEDIEVNKIFIKNMEKMFSSDGDSVNILGRYKVGEMQMYVVSVGTRLRLNIGGNQTRDYLLLRVIPLEQIKKIWIFPMDYSSAEVGIITRNGSYVIPSASMKSESFLDMIRYYNYADDYNKIDQLKEQLETSQSGQLELKNSRGENCVWYYSAFDDESGLDILGVIRSESLFATDRNNWGVVFIIGGTLLLIGIMDGLHIMRINKKLRETAAMAERASQAKTQFLSSMSHDIRTPMNAVIGMTEIAKKNINDPEYVRVCLDKVSTAGNHLITLINDILDISKVESGRMALNPSVFSIEELIHSIVGMIRPQMEQKNLTLDGEYSSFTHKLLFADELRLNQIYLNILNNSVKYTPEGGKITLNIYEEPTESDGEICLVFIAADNGIGMTEEFQKNMYDSFERATNTRINKIQGSGLGLAIVKQLVDLMGGTIECDSAPDKGTKFTVRIFIPVAEQPELISGTADLSGQGSSDDVSGMHILIAEDNDLNWEIAETMLSEYGVTCERAENGSICTEMLNNAPDWKYDMVLMDIQMPVMNGREATRLIRKSDREYLKKIMIVAMTADAFAEDVQACIDSGMNGHVSKPIDITKILDYVKKARDNRKKVQQ